MPNHLADELSPYLLQHAGNPVDWRPWGAEALIGPAEKRNRSSYRSATPSCHWCHVMAHDSFRRSRNRPAAQRTLRQHQGRSRGAARSGSDLHGGRADDDRPGRLADVGVPDAGGRAVFRRHVLAAPGPRRHAGLRPGVAGRSRRLAAVAARSCSCRPAGSRRCCARTKIVGCVKRTGQIRQPRLVRFTHPTISRNHNARPRRPCGKRSIPSRAALGPRRSSPSRWPCDGCWDAGAGRATANC